MTTRRSVLAAALASPFIIGCADTVRGFIYYPPDRSPSVALAGDPERVTVRTEDGLDLLGAYFAPAPGQPVIVFFHGNASDLFSVSRALAPLKGQGVGVLMAEYRGYFGNPGAPSEDGLAKDAHAFYAEAVRRAGADGRVIAAGHSLGGGVATRLATERPVAGLMTLATFTATTDVAPWLVSGLVPDRFANIDRIAKIKAPMLIAHGDADDVIPIAQGQRLRDALQASGQPGAYLAMPGVGHAPPAERVRRLLQTTALALDEGRAAAFTDGVSAPAIGLGPWRVA